MPTKTEPDTKSAKSEAKRLAALLVPGEVVTEYSAGVKLGYRFGERAAFGALAIKVLLSGKHVTPTTHPSGFTGYKFTHKKEQPKPKKPAKAKAPPKPKIKNNCDKNGMLSAKARETLWEKFPWLKPQKDSTSTSSSCTL
jgi:hypothetical protein